MAKRKLTPMEEHFLSWYESNKKKVGYKIHKFLNPDCKDCKRNDKLKRELM